MGHGITFAQQKGGSGKTTVLAHLAAAWAEAGRTVAVIDLDPQQSLTRWAKLRADQGIAVVESKDYRAGSDIKAARKTHDIVLVDCPGAASSLLESAIRESDLVLAPCQPSVMDVWALASVLETARKLKRPVRILLNRMPPRLGSLEEVLSRSATTARCCWRASSATATASPRRCSPAAPPPSSPPARPPPPRPTACAPSSARCSPGSDGYRRSA